VTMVTFVTKVASTFIVTMAALSWLLTHLGWQVYKNIPEVFQPGDTSYLVLSKSHSTLRKNIKASQYALKQ
jgi:hypothetical protein